MQFIELELIDPNPFQPRQSIDAAGVADLAANILATRASAPDTLGLLQSPRGRSRDDGRVQMAYGHRRLAAFRLLASQGHDDYARFPIELTDLSDADMAVVAWAENTARADLNLMEEADFVLRIMEEFGWTAREAAERLGLKYSTISSTLRLRSLPGDICDMIAAGKIVRARAIALVPLMDQVPAAELLRLAYSAATVNYRDWQSKMSEAHAITSRGVEINATVIAPAARVLADAMKNDQPGAWRIIARAIVPKTANCDNALALATMILERATLKAQSLHSGKKRLNEIFEEAGLTPPWDAAATARVTEFLAWRASRRAA